MQAHAQNTETLKKSLEGDKIVCEETIGDISKPEIEEVQQTKSLDECETSVKENITDEHTGDDEDVDKNNQMTDFKPREEKMEASYEDETASEEILKCGSVGLVASPQETAKSPRKSPFQDVINEDKLDENVFGENNIKLDDKDIRNNDDHSDSLCTKVTDTEHDQKINYATSEEVDTQKGILEIDSSLKKDENSEENKIDLNTLDESKSYEELIAGQPETIANVYGNEDTLSLLEKTYERKENLYTSSPVVTDEANESQESGRLVIDEKASTESSALTPTKDFKSLNTIIDIDNDDKEKNIEKGKAKHLEIEETENTTATVVIEIDDDDEIVNKKPNVSNTEEDSSNSKGNKEVTVPVQAAKNEDSNQETELKTDEVTTSTTCAKMHTMPIIFYNKECINFECSKNHKEFHRAPQFAMNYFKVVKKKMKVQYICGECYDMALNFYKDLSSLLSAKQPILLRDITSKKQEFVEILDSSDEEDVSSSEAENKEKENSSFSKADLKLIEAELENSIRSTFNRVDIQNQLTWSKTIFTERVQTLQNELEYIDSELRQQQKMADKMYKDLYESGKYRIKTLKPIDLDNENGDQIPPYGETERPPIKIGELYYAAKHKAIACWMTCKVVDQLDSNQVGSQKNVPNYRVKFVNTQYQTLKNLSAKLIAYYDPPTVRLNVGQRVIAYFDGTTISPRDKDKFVVQSAFYPGIIAEEMKPNNFFRYLIFYDDGYTQYVSHKDVRLVCHVAKNVWEDVDQSSREFIQKYIMEYRVNRPMVQTHKGQKMATESNGRWVPARVIDIDCSLVRMQFEGPHKNHKEWIYRGSLRLNPVYMEYQKSKNSQTTQMHVSRLPRRTEPFIRYTEDEESIRGSLGAQQRNVNRLDNAAATNQAPKVRHLNANTIYLEDESKPKGKVIYYTAKRQLPPKTFVPHECGSDCLIVVPHNLNGYSPLAKPLLSGWERIFFRQKIKKSVFYRAPCGRSFRNMKELHHYLRLTKNTLNVDCFDFYPETSCLAEFEAENIILRKRDISNGQEKMPLPLVNYYDESLPECTYSAKVIPTEGVNINTNPDFLICCDCEDDCVDKEKCACWKLTIEGVRSINPDALIEDIGYQYKRLYEHLPTGIYECNSRCKCKSHCINRVVQHSLEMKLQVFKTSNRGWGLRCLNDVPRGSFVCIYAGNLLTESKANEGGLDAGDEYFAELDYIETVEQLKEGYESDVETHEDEEDEDPYTPDDDDDFRPGKSFSNRSKRSQRQLSSEGERKAINFNPNVAMEDDTKKKRPSVRQFFGKDEAVYVMDAKVTGNLGRYFNHSCSPNLFVQNVFVDTHDVRFPWVAFFALTHIRAGTELTWNYNYEVGVVPGKVLYCQCGAPNCRQRLL